MRLKSYKKSNCRKPRIIRISKNKKPKSKGQIKNFKKEKYLSRLYSNSNSLKTAYV